MRKVEVHYENGRAVAPPATVERGRQSWLNVLVGLFVGKRVAYPTVKKFLEAKWKIKNLDIKLQKGLFYIKIDSDDVRASILEAGPVFILGRIFVIQRWHPEVEELRSKIDRVPVWAKLWDLPKELWGDIDEDEGLNWAASLIGEPKAMDENTKQRRRLDFARVCVIISAEKEIPRTVPIFVGRETDFSVEYEWLPEVCEKCKVFGHDTLACQKKVSKNWVPRANGNLGQREAVIEPGSNENHSSQDIDMGGKDVDDPSKVSDSFPSVASNGLEMVVFAGQDTSENGSINTIVLVEEDNALGTGQEVVNTSANKFNALLDIMEEEDSEEGSSVPTEGEEHLFTDHMQDYAKAKGKQQVSQVCTRSKYKESEEGDIKLKKKRLDPSLNARGRGRGRGRGKPGGHNTWK